jgi:hypothetical protein
MSLSTLKRTAGLIFWNFCHFSHNPFRLVVWRFCIPFLILGPLPLFEFCFSSTANLNRTNYLHFAWGWDLFYPGISSVGYAVELDLAIAVPWPNDNFAEANQDF